jgi:glucuronoarabinoxylan endo-1,4-beta-xylanase
MIRIPRVTAGPRPAPVGRRGLFLCLLWMVTVGSALPETGSLVPAETHQTIEGFGGSLYYYGGWVAAHPYKKEIYDLLFKDLGVDILRLGNEVGYGTFNPPGPEFVSEAEARRGRPIKVLLSSWSPPAYLKSNGSTKNGGTLAKVDGRYDYKGYAEYWADSFEAYSEIGVVPDYLSIQNEPGFVAGWETCELAATEGGGKAGYDSALAAVAAEFAARGIQTKLLAPEVLGIQSSLVQSYARHFNKDAVYGYAHHLYGSGDAKSPDTFLPAMRSLVRDLNDKPFFQTEYSDQNLDGFNLAWLMHNSLATEEVSAYLHWGLAWPDYPGSELIQIDNPWDRGSWVETKGYRASDRYYAFRQFSRFIDPGWKRITATTASKNLRLSAFISADGDSLTAVVLNVSSAPLAISLDLGGFVPAASSRVRTSASEKGQELGPVDAAAGFDLPAKSITTVVFTGALSSAPVRPRRPAGFLLGPAYPNPFNPATGITYAIPERTAVRIEVFSSDGRKVRTLVNAEEQAGEYLAEWDGLDDAGLRAVSGVYFCRMTAGSFTRTVKMTVMK